MNDGARVREKQKRERAKMEWGGREVDKSNRTRLSLVLLRTFPEGQPRL